MTPVNSASRFRFGVAAGTPLAAGLVLSAIFILGARHQAQLQADLGLRSAAAMAGPQVVSEISAAMAAASAGPGSNDVVVSPDKIGDAAVSTPAAIEARDTGTAVLDDRASAASIVVPIYRTAAAPTSTAARREAITGFRIVPLVLQPLLARLATGKSGGIAVLGPRRTIAAQPGPPPNGSRSFIVGLDLAGSPGWRVQSWRLEPPIPSATWFWVIGALLLFGGLAAGLGVGQGRERAAHARQLRFERDRTLVNGLAPVLQASLDLGAVIPAVADHLVEGLELAGLSLTTPSDRGERQLFTTGVAPEARTLPSGVPPGGLTPGQTFAMSLTRGGRILGVLRVVAGAPLTREDLLALGTASELVGSALANAEAFARQQDLVERMRSVDELKTVFLATASHELRTPVTAIAGFSALLVEHWQTMADQDRQQMMARVLANSRRLEALTNQLLDFAQLETGLPGIGDDVLDLGATVATIIGQQPELTSDHQLVTHLDERCLVRGSASALERVVTNLVGNAAKYSPALTVITVTVWTDGDQAVLLVDDEGPGVAEADRERVFSRFYRGRDDAVTRTRGTGVGLAIVAEYAASMSGIATVSTAPSGGARFSISFPVLGISAPAGAEGETYVPHS